MEPLTMLSTALAVAKTLRDLAKSSQPSIEEIRASIGELHEALNDLSGAVVDGRRREAELGDEMRRLKDELSSLRDWKTILSEYRLESVGPGVLTYVHEQSKGDPTTAHWLCQPCADAGHKAVLQCTSRAVSCTFTCPRCKNGLRASEEASKSLGAEPYAMSL